MKGVLAALVFGLVGLAATHPAAPTAPAASAAAEWQGGRMALDTSQFSHTRHAKLFPTCIVCHAGIEQPGEPVFPAAEQCAECHDGKIQKVVPYTPPALPRTNLDFDHARHARGIAAAGKPVQACTDCHETSGAPWMHVQFAALTQCFACHGVTAPHVQAPDTACARCHLPLASAAKLTTADIKALPKPPSHDAPDFVLGGHGKLATAEPGQPVAASCATCHARDFCLQCHVDAPEQTAIQALLPDPRSTVLHASLEAPPSHHADNFLATHGTTKLSGKGECATCHTRESCLTCHLATPNVAKGLYAAGSGRAKGATVVRTKPANHTDEFVQHGHALLASARSATCVSCHVRQDCLECHRPSAASGVRYHPATFLESHPAAAYARETSCNDCHNPRQFCASCHKQAGLTSNGPLKAGFHDAKPFFIAGHGQAARQSLETCTSCHSEKDCLACHSGIGGRRFNPHGPGFNPEEMKKKNPETCTVCHGTNIPG
jgi:Doubled CXXCH motif (Paired_CXXCH_1)